MKYSPTESTKLVLGENFSTQNPFWKTSFRKEFNIDLGMT